MTDKLDKCPKCGEDGACYITPFNEVKNNYFCWGCGFYTNDTLKRDEYNSEEYESTLPELYKDLKYTDSENRIWYPIVINNLEKGTVFINGTNVKNWQWCAILTRKLEGDELNSLANKGIEYKSDPTTTKFFGTDFLSACEYINII